ncbi:MAG: hypothetical protein AAF967_13000 [Pseudomonadota bacterium]
MAFLDSLFGIDDARDDLRLGRIESDASLDRGAAGSREGFRKARGGLKSGARAARKDLKRARREVEGGRDAALDFLDVDIDAGDAARENVLVALGLRGLDAQRDFFDNFQSDAGFQATLGAGLDAIDQSAAARGSIFSGGTQKDLFDFGQRQQASQFQDRLDRLTGLSTVGSNARANAANVSTGAGNALADLRASDADIDLNTSQGLAGLRTGEGDLAFALGQLRANNATSFNNALADTRGQGINNLFRIATEGAKAAAGFFPKGIG